MADPVLERLAADMAAEPLRRASEEGGGYQGLNPRAVEAILVANGFNTQVFTRLLAPEEPKLTEAFLRGVIYGRRSRNEGEGERRLRCMSAIAGVVGELAGFTYDEIWGHPNPLRRR